MASVQSYARRGVCPLEQWAVVGVTEVRDRRAKPERLCYPCLPVQLCCRHFVLGRSAWEPIGYELL